MTLESCNRADHQSCMGVKQSSCYHRGNNILCVVFGHNAFMSGGDRGAHTPTSFCQLGGFYPNPILLFWLCFKAVLSFFVSLMSSSCLFIKCLGLVVVNS